MAGDIMVFNHRSGILVPEDKAQSILAAATPYLEKSAKNISPKKVIQIEASALFSIMDPAQTGKFEISDLPSKLTLAQVISENRIVLLNQEELEKIAGMTLAEAKEALANQTDPSPTTGNGDKISPVIGGEAQESDYLKERVRDAAYYADQRQGGQGGEKDPYGQCL
jgi:hypothetical protein